jgi:hypothetical protein
MSTATSALIAKLEADVASVTDETDRLDAAVWLEEYAVALPASIASSANNIQSYSISGRQFSYRTLDELRGRVEWLRSQIDGVLYGRGGVVDNRYGIGGLTP